MSASAYSFQPAAGLPPAQLHGAFVTAFADYLLGPFQVALDAWPVFLGRQAVDLAHSVVAMRDGQVIAFCLVAPRPELGIWRLATMGAVPAARGSGAAAALLDDFLVRARQAGMHTAELECFAQNERAQRLYRGRGFAEIHALPGYLREAGGPVAGAGAGDFRDTDAPAVSLEDAYAWLDRCNLALGDLPLQVTPRALRALPLALQAWRLGSAQLVFAVTGPDALSVCSLVDTGAGQLGAQALVARLARDFSGHRITVPQLQRPDLGGQALERLGFSRQPLHQLLMRRALTHAPGN